MAPVMSAYGALDKSAFINEVLPAPRTIGDFAYLSDDVLGFITDFLPHKDVYHITLLSNSNLYTKILDRRYYAFKNKRRENWKELFQCVIRIISLRMQCLHMVIVL